MRARRKAQPPSTTEPDARTTGRLDAFIGGLGLGVDLSGTVALCVRHVFTAFEPAGVTALVLKGPGIAALLYEEGEHRRYVDLDLLVPPHDLADAERIIAGLGYRDTTEEMGIDDIGGVVHAHTWRAVPPGGRFEVPVELHQWIPGARSEPEAAWWALWALRTTIEVAGTQIPVLDRPGQALQLALHVAQHGAEYRRGTAELRLALDRWPEEVWRQAARLGAEIEATDALAAGLRLVGPDGAQLATRLGLSANPGLEWEIRNQSERPRGAFHIEALRAAGSVRERLALVRRALIPDRRWIATEYHWAGAGPLRLAAGYVLHVARAPVWAARAWVFRRQARRRS